jgi:hypothetical protein
VVLSLSGLRDALLRWPGPVALIAFAQLLGTSLWFSANAAADDLARDWLMGAAGIGWLTAAVQTGFILGTLLVSLSGYADRFSASRIFVASALAGAVFNAGFAYLAQGLGSALVYRFCVGMALAGVYPLGMKLIISWAPERRGAALAQLVAMLTLGTALPHLLRALGADLPWQMIISAASILAVLGAGVVYVLGDGPHAHAPQQRLRAWRAGFDDIAQAFRQPGFRAAALGYFGHMWELYAFWTVVPLLLIGLGLDVGTSALAFVIIGAGAVGCLIGGRLSRGRLGSEGVALWALALSGSCLVVFALGWRLLPEGVLLAVLFVWGAAVIADSPQFSALSSAACAPSVVGAALAIQNAIGFSITVVSIALITGLIGQWGLDAVWVLLPGPVLGLIGFWRAGRR